jgi:hypothetical protein
MAITINPNTYAGNYASYMWLPAVFGMDTINKGLVSIHDGIKYREVIGTLDFSNPLQTRVATPAPNSSGTTIGERYLDAKDIMIYSEFNPADFEAHWLSEQLSRKLLDETLPMEVETYMTAMILSRAGEGLETNIWMGSTTYTATPGTAGNGQLVFFDGFLKQMIADAAINQFASPKTLTVGVTDGSHTNIVDALQGLIDLAAANKKALLSKPTRYERMKFIVSIATEQIYQNYLANSTTFKNNNTTDKGINKYLGYEIVVAAGIADNTILFCEAIMEPDGALHVGVNTMDDNTVTLNRVQNNSELFFVKGLMKMCVNYKNSSEIFLFTTLTAATFNA